MTPAEALAALQAAHRDGTAHPMPTLRGWVRLAGQGGRVRADVDADLTTGEATVQRITAAAPSCGSDAGVSGAKTL